VTCPLSLHDALPIFKPEDARDLAASFQACVADVAHDRTRRAVQMFRAKYDVPLHLVVAGGVAANSALRARLADLATAETLTLHTDRKSTRLNSSHVK